MITSAQLTRFILKVLCTNTRIYIQFERIIYIEDDNNLFLIAITRNNIIVCRNLMTQIENKFHIRITDENYMIYTSLLGGIKQIIDSRKNISFIDRL